MPTPTSDLMIGILMWMVVMIMPLLVLFIDNVQVRMTLLFLLYPSAMSFMARNPHFFISQSVIFGASLAAFLLFMLLRLSPQIRDLLKNPSEHKGKNIGILSGLLGLFFLVILVWGMTGMVYDSDVMAESAPPQNAY
jgi:hypothetical protein